jgi:hypothetical protein
VRNWLPSNIEFFECRVTPSYLEASIRRARSYIDDQWHLIIDRLLDALAFSGPRIHMVVEQLKAWP